MRSFSRTTLSALLICSAATAAFGQFQIRSHTIDGGGGYSAGDSFELEGTIGQPDAGPGDGAIAGGGFALAGGFWASATTGCTCPGDMNHDGSRDGRDVQQFVSCVIGGAGCACADVDGVGGVAVGDVSAFVADLLNASTCP